MIWNFAENTKKIKKKGSTLTNNGGMLFFLTKHNTD